MEIDVLTLFPKMFRGPFSESIVQRAVKKGLVTLRIVDIRRFSTDKHKKADDRPYGGGPGMILLVDPIVRALSALKKGRSPYVVLLSAGGKRLTQRTARKFSRKERLVLICGHYEGVDERIKRWVHEECSIGDYVLTGGEIPAMVVIDSVIRFLPGVLGDERSSDSDSFEEGLLEYPQYTRPRVYRGLKVPEVLLSGNHQQIAAWRKRQALAKTARNRPELLKEVSQ